MPKISSTLDKAMELVGSFVPVDAEGVDDAQLRCAVLRDAQAQRLIVIAFIQRLENDAAFQSALADGSGQIAGAKTATEMAIIDAQMRTRLATRGTQHRAGRRGVEVFYDARYMKKPKMVRLSGSDMFNYVGVQQLKQLKMDFEMVSYNPIRKNPAVLLETLQAMVPLLAQAPNIDTFKLFEELVSGLGLPNRLIIPEAQARQAQMAAAQAAAPSSSRSPRAEPRSKAPQRRTESQSQAQGEMHLPLKFFGIQRMAQMHHLSRVEDGQAHRRNEGLREHQG